MVEGVGSVTGRRTDPGKEDGTSFRAKGGRGWVQRGRCG